MIYGMHVQWEGDVGHQVYDFYGVMGFSISLEHYEDL